MAKSVDNMDSSEPIEETASQRILNAAREHLFRFGYGSFTMDDLARELGMSKKTLYVYFPGKEAIADKIVELIGRHISTRLDAVTSDKSKSFVQKLCAVVDVIGGQMSKVSPLLLRDLQRFAPSAYARMDQLRQKNIPLYFGRLIREGIAEGRIRGDVDPDFTAQFWLQAIRGLLQPDVLERTQLTPRQTLEKAINLFFSGLLSPAGRQDYEKHISDCRKHTGDLA
jgi:AcrR family transcriptional regulator